MPGQTS